MKLLGHTSFSSILFRARMRVPDFLLDKNEVEPVYVYFMHYLFLLLIACSFLSATEFTVCSYNCGSLPNYYDYLRAASMQKLMQERYNAEPEKMLLNENIQKLALKILFTQDAQEKALLQHEWEEKEYQHTFAQLIKESRWGQRINEIITPYNIRPTVIHDAEVLQMLGERLDDLSLTYASMAKDIFAHYVKYDIICLQEADYLNETLFPECYQVILSKNGIAWNKERFELLKTIKNRYVIVQLRDKESDRTLLVASGHISGCNPYWIEQNDSAKGDQELQTIIDLLEKNDADLKLIGIDSNVTSLHPRLSILKEANYQIDYKNYLEPTCTNPHFALDTRIDWIALKSSEKATIINIPVLSVGLNTLQTNMSDHKPIAAKIIY